MTSLPDIPQYTDVARVAEAGQRFRRLRALIYDERRRHRLLFLASLLALGCVAALGSLAYAPRILSFDLRTTLGLQAIDIAFFGPLMTNVSIFGSAYGAIGSVSFGVLLLALLLGWKDGSYLLFVVVLQGVVNLLIKTAIGRARPFSPLVQVFTSTNGNSFPSGHVMFYVVFFGFLFFLAWTRLPRSLWRTLALVFTEILVFLIGPSRIYLGAHWLSDVLAAYLLSFVILAFAIEFYLRYLAPRTFEDEGGLVGKRDAER